MVITGEGSTRNTVAAGKALTAKRASKARFICSHAIVWYNPPVIEIAAIVFLFIVLIGVLDARFG